MTEYRPRLSKLEFDLIVEHRKLISNDDSNRVLSIGDLHEPFTKDGYLEHCLEIQDKYKTNITVFTGDILDNHHSSFHFPDPDGMSALEELEKSKAKIARWHDAFPDAVVTIGNHDRIPNRKAFVSGVSSAWIKSMSEVLDTPSWKYVEEIVIDGVLYVHGENRQADMRSKNDQVSVVQGHWHTKGYITYGVGINHRIFALQNGCGIDNKSYAMAYGKHFNKPHIACAVILDNGQLPILEYMKL